MPAGHVWGKIDLSMFFRSKIGIFGGLQLTFVATVSVD